MRLLERLPQEMDRSYALRTIKENIISLELLPGSQISEKQIANLMGLSRTPIREAMIDLSRVRIIDIIPQKRSVVSLIDYKLVEDACFMRNTLECAVVALACKSIDLGNLYCLEENVQLQDFYVGNNNPKKMMELDNQFHKILFDITQKTQVYEMMQDFLIHLNRIQKLAFDANKTAEIVQEHIMLLIAIRNRDSMKAKQLIQMHLSRHIADVKMIRENYPQFFKQ